MIDKQKKAPGEALVSTILFDNVSEVIHDRVNIRDIKPMTDREYCVRGCTALLDAIGGAIHHIGNVHKYAREEDVPAHTLFVITTDGMENASRRYDSARVKQMIELRRASMVGNSCPSAPILTPSRRQSILVLVKTARSITTPTAWGQG